MAKVTRCDRCGKDLQARKAFIDATFHYDTVNNSEGRWTFDFCDDCWRSVAAKLVEKVRNS